MKDKNIFLQTVRGVCIIFVILIHCKYINNEGQAWHNYSLILRQFINFPVAVFIFLSGYFTDINKKYSISSIIKRLKRLLIPYMIWTIIYTVINQKITGNWSIIEILHNMIFGSASGQMYFVLVMVQFTVIIPIIQNVMKKWWGSILFLITPIYYIIMYITYITGYEIPFRTTLFPAWFIYFYIGIYVRKNDIKQISEYWYVLILAGLMLSVIEGYIIDYKMHLYGFAVSQVKISSCLYAVAVINLVMIINNNVKMTKNVISNIGDNSYGIFYSHMIFVNICTIMMGKLHMGIIPLPLYQLIQLSVSIIVSCMFIKILKLVLGKYSYLIGA